jgi:hypothetical protein
MARWSARFGGQRAAVEFVVNSGNNENEKKIATELSGEKDSDAS